MDSSDKRSNPGARGRTVRSRRAVSPWLACAVLFVAAAACVFASGAVHGMARGLPLGVAVALIASGGMIIGIRIARRADSLVSSRSEPRPPDRGGPRQETPHARA